MQSLEENIFIVETCLSHGETKLHFSIQRQKRFIMERFMTTLQSLSPQISFTNFFPTINQVDFGFAVSTNYRFRFKFASTNIIHILLLRKSEPKDRQRFIRSTQTEFLNYQQVFQLPDVEYEKCNTTVIRFTVNKDLSNIENLCQQALNFMIKDKIL
jgi:hypothetical protein